MADKTFADEFLEMAAPASREMEEKFRAMMADLRPTVVAADKVRLTEWEDMALEDEEALLERLSDNGN